LLCFRELRREVEIGWRIWKVLWKRCATRILVEAGDWAGACQPAEGLSALQRDARIEAGNDRLDRFHPCSPRKERPLGMSGRFIQIQRPKVEPFSRAIQADRAGFPAVEHSQPGENRKSVTVFGREGKKPNGLRRFDRKSVPVWVRFPETGAGAGGCCSSPIPFRGRSGQSISS